MYPVPIKLPDGKRVYAIAMRPLADVISRRDPNTGAILHQAAGRRSSASTASGLSTISEGRKSSFASSGTSSNTPSVQPKATRPNARKPSATPTASRHSGDPKLIRRQSPPIRQLAKPVANKASGTSERQINQLPTQASRRLYPGPAETDHWDTGPGLREYAKRIFTKLR